MQVFFRSVSAFCSRPLQLLYYTTFFEVCQVFFQTFFQKFFALSLTKSLAVFDSQSLFSARSSAPQSVLLSTLSITLSICGFAPCFELFFNCSRLTTLLLYHTFRGLSSRRIFTFAMFFYAYCQPVFSSQISSAFQFLFIICVLLLCAWFLLFFPVSPYTLHREF